MQASEPSGLLYLRARYYAPEQGRFISRDTWEGDSNQPMSFNQWEYVVENPINRVDPTGNCFTSLNPFKNDWSRIGEQPIFGMCSSGTVQPPTPPTPTPAPSPSPTCTPTITPTPIPPTPTPIQNWFEFPDYWTITFYVTALENDPYFLTSGPYPSGATSPLHGLDQSISYNLNWAHNVAQGQGQGKARDGRYVTKDWITTEQKNDGYTYFKYGKGGRFGPPRAWETVAAAVGPGYRLQPHNRVKIANLPPPYQDKGPFEVLDTGDNIGESHLDVFIGDEFIQTANNLGTIYRKVSVLLSPQSP